MPDNLHGGSLTPYRMPSGGKPFFGICGAYTPYNDLRTTLANTTVVTNPAGGADIVPWMLYTDLHTAGDCSQNDNCPSGNCGSWLTPSLYTLTAGSTTPPTWPQNFTAQTPPTNFSKCYKRGHKDVAAALEWNGSYGFLDADGNNCLDTVCSTLTTDFDGRNPGDTGYVNTYDRRYYRAYQATPAGTKYLKNTFSLKLSRETKSRHTTTSAGPNGGTLTGDITETITLSGSCSVDPLSGEEIFTLGTWSFTTTDNLTGITTPISPSDSTYYPDVVAVWGDANTMPNCFVDIASIAGGGPQSPLGARIPQEIDGYTSAGYSYTDTTPDGIGTFWSGFNNSNAIDVSRSNTSYSATSTQTKWDGDIENPGPDDWNTTEVIYTYDVTFDLSDTSTPNAGISGGNYDLVYDRDQNLLPLWPLNDDALYPWRTDSFIQIMPLVTRNQNNASLAFFPAIGRTMNDINSLTTDQNGNNPPGPGPNDCDGLPPSDPGYTGPCPYVTTYTQIPWKDPNVWQWDGPPGSATLVKMVDGGILGAPAETGAQNCFMPDFQDWRGCCYDQLIPGTETDVLYFILYIYGEGRWVNSFDGTAQRQGFNQFIPGLQLPTTATRWTNLRESAILNTCAFTSYGDPALMPQPTLADPADVGCAFRDTAGDVTQPPGGDSRLWGVKRAWCLELFESINYARPGGEDKFVISEDDTLTFCYVSDTLVTVAGVTTGTITVNAKDGTSPGSLPFTAGQIVGGKCVNGFYTVASTAVNVITVSGKAFDLPSDWVASQLRDPDTIFGKLIYNTAPSVLGRASITAVADVSANPPFAGGWTPTYKFGTTQTNFGLDATVATLAQEQVDIWNSSMNGDGSTGLLASNVTATRTDTDTFKVAASYPTACFLTIHGATNYKYDDNTPKDDFVFLEWFHDFRNMSTGEPNRLGTTVACDGSTVLLPTTVTYPDSDGHGTSVTVAMPTNGYSKFVQHPSDELEFIPHFSRCAPRVFCVSPNGETWDNGVTIPFPVMTLDALYGSKWEMDLIQSIDDPFSQAPHKPCAIGDFSGSAVRWIEDDGTCMVDQTSDTFVTAFYPIVPQVEARLAVPSGSPALPSGITLGFVNPVNNTPGAQPPAPPGYDETFKPMEAKTAWGMITNICTALGGDCTFASSYQSWVFCPPLT